MARKRKGVRKTAISVAPDVLAHAQQMVKQGIATSVSGYFSVLATRDRARRDLLGYIADLESELGLSDADRKRLDQELGLRVPRRSPAKSAAAARRAS
jgi:hypothetical protein